MLPTWPRSEVSSTLLAAPLVQTACPSTRAGSSSSSRMPTVGSPSCKPLAHQTCVQAAAPVLACQLCSCAAYGRPTGCVRLLRDFLRLWAAPLLFENEVAMVFYSLLEMEGAADHTSPILPPNFFEKVLDHRAQYAWLVPCTRWHSMISFYFAGSTTL